MVQVPLLQLLKSTLVSRTNQLLRGWLTPLLVCCVFAAAVPLVYGAIQ